MPKSTRDKEPQRRRSRGWLFAVAAGVVVLLAAGIYLLRTPSQSSPSPTSQADTPVKKTALPAIPHQPRPKSMAPQIFADPSIRKAYEVAYNNPELLERMPCYCGCYGTAGHTNNLDCFTDRHGET